VRNFFTVQDFFTVIVMPFNWRRLRDTSQDQFDNKRWRAELTVLVQEDDAIREDGRRVCKTNLLALCWVLGFCLVDEEVHHDAIAFFLPKEPGLMLDDWLAQSSKIFLRRASLLLPRGVYKTTISLANCAQLIINWPLTVAIMIMCGRRDLAWDFVGQVGGFFHREPNRSPTLFQALFPELCVTKKPEAGEFTAALRQQEPRIIEPAIWGESVESGVSGYHPNVLVIDDISNNRNSQKFETRVQVTKKYKLNRKVLVSKGIELKVGTIYGTGDIFTDEVLTSRPGTIRRLIKPAMRLKSGERLDQNGFPDEDEVDLYFPTILSYDYLRTEYESGFESFCTQYMLDEFGAAEVVFDKEQLLRVMVDEEALPMEGRYFIHWRFPCAKKQWRTACAAVGILNRNRCFIVETIEGHYKPSQLSKHVVNLARKYGLHRISIEDSPGAVLAQSAIHNYALTTGWDVGIDWKAFDEDTGERDVRIRNIEADLATGRLFFNAGMKHLPALMLEMTQYGMLPDNAIPDCVARVSDELLPQSIAAEDLEDEASAWEAARDREKYNLIYNRGPYARPEPEPEEMEAVEPRIEDQKFTSQGLTIEIPGLEY
jgi:hypothetical protein